MPLDDEENAELETGRGAAELKGRPVSSVEEVTDDVNFKALMERGNASMGMDRG